ncbi:hypothetical protein AB07_2068 [Citrobacter freundii]|uniref:Uncharacterized protein n=1 Tax=Citrobacter freundii TaxID=546 RepID=A0A7G2INF0_CITFR|nr:hypothetical protein AB07_2068 [Citrobacter freundii]CDL37569.1 hypothetical protein [Citrobacter freundii]
MHRLRVVGREASRKTDLQQPTLFQYVATDYVKTACGPFCFV